MDPKDATRRGIIKQGLVDPDAFYKGISSQCNHLSPEVVEQVYDGLVRHITSELRNKKAVDLPGLGYFALVRYGAKSGVAGPTRKDIPPKLVLKFYALERWRRYFRSIFPGT